MTARARSTSRFAAQLMAGPEREGVALGHGYVRFRDDVVALTPLGAPRMPNGIETDVVLRVGETVRIGAGLLRTETATVTTGPVWEARPSPRFAVAVRPSPDLDLERLCGWGPGLTPLGDDILAGRLAARALAGDPAPHREWAGRTTALSSTLLSLAALGELPEPAHRLLEDGDPEPLLRFGATSGKGLLLGLAPATAANGSARAGWSIELTLPDGPRTFDVTLHPSRETTEGGSGRPPMHERPRRGSLRVTKEEL